jgi:hypothetical protein
MRAKVRKIQKDFDVLVESKGGKEFGESVKWERRV